MSNYSAKRWPLVIDLVILNHDQVTWMTSELVPASPNFHTTQTGEHLSLELFNVHWHHLLHSWRGHGSQVVKVSDRGGPCHEFEPSTTKDPPCRGAMHVKSVETSKKSFRRCGAIVRRGGASSIVVHVT
ncbi:hypothetical protein TNCV_1662391 [Trichonephila clavipes]|nr:hypothetical protein TNCV_1662391 [Trichonephila clavipes]